MAQSRPDTDMGSTPEVKRPQNLLVQQPKEVQELADLLKQLPETIEDSMPSEKQSTKPALFRMIKKDSSAPPPRAQAILNLPEPKVMQRKLKRHIKKEIRNLRKEARGIVRVGKPGNANKLNLLYARIRRLRGLLSALLEASVEVIKRLFIRVFIDKQSIA